MHLLCSLLVPELVPAQPPRRRPPFPLKAQPWCLSLGLRVVTLQRLCKCEWCDVWCVSGSVTIQTVLKLTLPSSFLLYPLPLSSPPFPSSGRWDYELYLRFDLYTNKHTQWFFFSVQNMRPRQTYRFTIVNLYKVGQQGLVLSHREVIIISD